MTDVQTVHLRGQGGLVIGHDLPLPENIADQLTKGYLQRVNPDGSSYEPEPDLPASAAVGVPAATKPAASAPKAEWIGWAVVQGATPDDAEAMTKTDLIEKYGK